MNQIMTFGQRYGKWIAAGVVSAVVAVGAVVAYNYYTDEDESAEIVTEDAEPEQTDEV